MKTTYARKWAALLASVAVVLQLQANYAVFDQHTDTIQVAGQTVLDQTATYEAVILLRSGHAHGGTVFNEFTNGQEDKWLGVMPNVIQGDNYESTGSGPLMHLYSKTPVALDTWHHIAFVTDASEDRLYLDGVLVAAQPRYGPIQNGSGGAFIGAISRAGSLRVFVGVLDSVRLSSVARYSGLHFTPPAGDLESDASTVLLYNFRDTAGSTTVADESPQRRTGTLGVGFTGATAPKLVQSLSDLPANAVRDLVIDPRATYLRINADRAFNAVPIPLTSLGLAGGDSVFLQTIGDCNQTGDYENATENLTVGLVGVFSSSAELGPRADLHRVAGAIETGPDISTPDTATGSLATDIPEDFGIPRTGLFLTVPEGAQFLFVAGGAEKYQDNRDWDGNFGLHISKMTLGTKQVNGKVVLNWDAGSLQSKPNLSEPWTDVLGANPPHTVTPDKPREFYQLK